MNITRVIHEVETVARAEATALSVQFAGFRGL